MKFQRLRAKSGDGSRASEFLTQHLRDVWCAAGRILDATGAQQLEALGLKPDAHLDRLRRIVLLAAAAHDLGKANDHFQGMVWRQRDVRVHPQAIRHEWVTILLLAELREWLLPALDGSATDFAIMEWAVAGHHLTPAPTSPAEQGGQGTEITILQGHADFAEALTWLSETFGLSTAPSRVDITRDLVDDGSPFDEIARWGQTARQTWSEIRGERRLIAAVKNCLIAADIAGSALPRIRSQNQPRWEWIDESFRDLPQPGDLQSIVDFRLGGATPRPFQRAVAAASRAVKLVKAGCGSGKTCAAYMWAAENHPTRRLYFCYPTTGTATEGFKDYLFDEAEKAPRVGADLFHGRAPIDFEIILDCGPDARSQSDEDARLDALRAWKTPIVSCTVDTVLGVVQNNRRGLYSWPALAQAAFVFDEIHSYDDRLFGALLRFLRDVPGVPVLLMTASLPAEREDALREVVAATDRGFEVVEGPAESLEELPRYHRLAVDQGNPLPAIKLALANGDKVLWVSNTVQRVMDWADRVATLGVAPLIYHSRFKYADRVARHKALVEAFDPRHAGSVVACASQVAEMSLDSKGCTLLITDRATVPALIQRLGRLNRQAKTGDRTQPFIVLVPDSELPYTPEQLAAAETWLAKLPPVDISQACLVRAWDQSEAEVIEGISSTWLDGGYVTISTELRESSPGITVVMKEDVPRILARPIDLARYALPMPPTKRDWKAWDRIRGIPIAPSGTIRYNAMRGAEWEK